MTIYNAVMTKRSSICFPSSIVEVLFVSLILCFIFQRVFVLNPTTINVMERGHF